MALDASFSTLPFPKAGLPVHPSRQRLLRLVGRRQETPDVVTFDFEVLDNRLRHHPGQAIALDLPMAGGTATRTFTLASSGIDPRRVSVTVKAGAPGNATRWMHETLHPGAEITARGPFGRFTLAAHPGKPLLLVGGGSGFTPMMSMLRWLHARRETADVAAIQVARRVEDLLFTEELGRIAADMPNLRLFDVVTAPGAGEAWRGYRGRPDRAMIRAMFPDVGRRVAFCCGPEGFMSQMRRVLSAEGLDASQFHTENFGTAPVRITEAPASDDAARDGVAVKYRGQTHDLPPDQPLSTALAARGQRIPTGCGEGQCGTCRLRLLEGEVEMQQQGGLSEREVEQGYILACCSRPKGPVTLADPA